MITPLNPPEAWARIVDETRKFFAGIGAERAVIGLSGGVDCALVAAIAAEAIGPDNLLGVRMPSKHTSRASLKDAFDLADNLGIDCATVSIADSYSAVTEELVTALNPKGSPDELRRREILANQPWNRYDPTPSVAEENVQSRLRGLILMTISNKTGALVLNTGNRSELLTGYFTVHGDSVGAFAPIAGLYKTQVYQLSTWRNEQGIVIPTSTLTKAPTAELAPNQTDQDSLPPYELLDPALDMIERRNAAGREISADLVEEILRENISPETRVDSNVVSAEVLRDTIRLWRGSAFKRVSRLPTVSFG